MGGGRRGRGGEGGAWGERCIWLCTYRGKKQGEKYIHPLRDPLNYICMQTSGGVYVYIYIYICIKVKKKEREKKKEGMRRISLGDAEGGGEGKKGWGGRKCPPPQWQQGRGRALGAAAASPSHRAPLRAPAALRGRPSITARGHQGKLMTGRRRHVTPLKDPIFGQRGEGEKKEESPPINSAL